MSLFAGISVKTGLMHPKVPSPCNCSVRLSFSSMKARKMDPE